MNTPRSSALSLLLALSATSASAATVIDLTPDGITNPNHVQYRAQCCVVADRPDYNPPLSASMGVTFKPTGPDLWLDNFSLYLRQRTDITGQLSGYTNTGGSMDFRAYIGTWGYNQALPAASSGDLIQVLYTSEITTTANNSDIQPFTFTPGIQLAANQWYFAFISPEGLDLQALRSYEMPVSYDGNPTPTLSPNLWSVSSNNDFNQLLTNNWTAGWGPAWFDATLTPAPVPIPPAIWLFGSALLGLAGLARRKGN
jgi:hypothetical protein